MDLTAALEALSGVNARVQNLEDNFMLSGKEFHSEPSPERQRGTHDTPGLETALRHLGSLNARVEHISGRPTTALLYSNLSDERQRHVHDGLDESTSAQRILSSSDDEVQDMLREQQRAQHGATGGGKGALHQEARTIGHQQLDALFDEDGGSAQVRRRPWSGVGWGMRRDSQRSMRSGVSGAGCPHAAMVPHEALHHYLHVRHQILMLRLLAGLGRDAGPRERAQAAAALRAIVYELHSPEGAAAAAAAAAGGGGGGGGCSEEEEEEDPAARGYSYLLDSDEGEEEGEEGADDEGYGEGDADYRKNFEKYLATQHGIQPSKQVGEGEEEGGGKEEDEEALLQWALSLGDEQALLQHMHTRAHAHARGHAHARPHPHAVLRDVAYLAGPSSLPLMPHLRRLPPLPRTRGVGRLKTLCATCGDARLCARNSASLGHGAAEPLPLEQGSKMTLGFDGSRRDLIWNLA